MPNVKPVELQTNLEVKRRARKLTRDDLSKKSGVPINIIRDWEQFPGRINRGEALSVLKVADVLKCKSIREVLELDDTKPYMQKAQKEAETE